MSGIAKTIFFVALSLFLCLCLDPQHAGAVQKRDLDADQKWEPIEGTLDGGHHRFAADEQAWLSVPKTTDKLDEKERERVRLAVVQTYLWEDGEVLQILPVAGSKRQYMVLLGRYTPEPHEDHNRLTLLLAKGRMTHENVWQSSQVVALPSSEEISVWDAQRAKRMEAEVNTAAAEKSQNGGQAADAVVPSIQHTVDQDVAFLDVDRDGSAELLIRVRYPVSAVSERTDLFVYAFPSLELRLVVPLRKQQTFRDQTLIEEACIKRLEHPLRFDLHVLAYDRRQCQTGPCSMQKSRGHVVYGFGTVPQVHDVRMPSEPAEVIESWSTNPTLMALPKQQGVDWVWPLEPKDPQAKKKRPPDAWLQAVAGQPVQSWALLEVDSYERRPGRNGPPKPLYHLDPVYYDMLVASQPARLQLREVGGATENTSKGWVRSWLTDVPVLDLPVPLGWEIAPIPVARWKIIKNMGIGARWLWIHVPLRRPGSSENREQMYVVDLNHYRLLWQHEGSGEGSSACRWRFFSRRLTRDDSVFELEGQCPGTPMQQEYWAIDLKTNHFRQATKDEIAGLGKRSVDLGDEKQRTLWAGDMVW